MNKRKNIYKSQWLDRTQKDWGALMASVKKSGFVVSYNIK